MRSGWSAGRPLSSWTSHTYTTTLHTYSSCLNLHLTFSSLASRPRHPWSSGGAFQGGKKGRCWTPQAATGGGSSPITRVLPPTPHTRLSCQQLSCSPGPTIFPRPPHQPHLSQHSQSLPARPRFLPSSPQIFCPRPKPHVSPLVGLLASAQIWSVVIYSGLVVVHQLALESFPTLRAPDDPSCGSVCSSCGIPSLLLCDLVCGRV